MTAWVVVAVQAAPGVTPFDSGMGALRAIGAMVLVLVILGGVLWVLRRGGFANARGGRQSMAVESALSLGERRSLVIVTVEGRRLLLGLAPTQVALITELPQAATTFNGTLDRAVNAVRDGAR